MKTADIEVGGEYYVAEGSGSYGRHNGFLAKVLATRVEYETTSYGGSSYYNSRKVTKRDGIRVMPLDGETVSSFMRRSDPTENDDSVVLVRPHQVLWLADHERARRQTKDRAAREQREAVARAERARLALGRGELSRYGSHILLTVEEAEELGRLVHAAVSPGVA